MKKTLGSVWISWGRKESSNLYTFFESLGTMIMFFVYVYCQNVFFFFLNIYKLVKQWYKVSVMLSSFLSDICVCSGLCRIYLLHGLYQCGNDKENGITTDYY